LARRIVALLSARIGAENLVKLYLVAAGAYNNVGLRSALTRVRARRVISLLFKNPISSSSEILSVVLFCVFRAQVERRDMSATAVESRHHDNSDVSDVKWDDSGIVIGKRRQPFAAVFKQRRLQKSAIGNESVPIQLAQCWFPGLAISNAKI